MSQPGPLPLLGGAVESLLHERASATPTPEHLAQAPASAAPAGQLGPPLQASVRELQTWFQAAISHPGPLDQGALASPLLASLDELPRLVTHGPHLDAFRRLGVYHYSYRARLIECLADDYPSLKIALGEDTFEALCLAYIQQHPSTAPSLNYYGRHMAAFCRQCDLPREPFPSLRGFCADLASLEWALVEVLHAPEAPTLSHHELSLIPPERWPAARLPPSEAARLLRFDYPVNGYFQKLREDEPATPPDPAPSATVVYRQGYTIWRMNLTPTMAGLLSSLFAGSTLGEALDAIPTPESDEAAAALEQSVMRWFSEWVAGGLFSALVL